MRAKKFVKKIVVRNNIGPNLVNVVNEMPVWSSFFCVIAGKSVKLSHPGLVIKECLSLKFVTNRLDSSSIDSKVIISDT